MDEQGKWAGRLAVLGAVVGVLALLAYPGYVNPVAAVLLYTVIGFAIGKGIDRLLAYVRK